MEEVFLPALIYIIGYAATAYLAQSINASLLAQSYEYCAEIE